MMVAVCFSCNSTTNSAKHSFDFDPNVNRQITSKFDNRIENPFFPNIVICQDLLAKIRAQRRVSLGFGDWFKSYHKDFNDLVDASTVDQLLYLLDDKSAVLACSAGWALIEKEVDSIPELYEKILEKNRRVQTQSGCLVSRSWISVQFYLYYETYKADSSFENKLVLEEMERIRYKNHCCPKQQKLSKKGSFEL